MKFPDCRFDLPLVLFSLLAIPSIVLTCGLAHYCRYLTSIHADDDFTQSVLNEAIATFELCANASELSLVAETYNLVSYIFYLFATSMWYAYSWDKACACPFGPLEDAIEGNIEPYEAVNKIVAQITGGFLSLYYVNFIYSLELLKIHEGKAWRQCSSPIRIPIILAILIEAAFTCTFRVLSKTINSTEYNKSGIITCFVGLMLVVIGREISLIAFDYPGGNLNPVLTSVSKFKCKDITAFQHICAFWIGPCLGSIASIYVNLLVNEKAA